MGAVKRKTFIITGAAGFLGNRIVQQALNRGHDVKAIIRPGRDVRGLSWKDNSMVELVEIDLADAETIFESISSLISKLDHGNLTFVHAAASFTGNDAVHSVQTVEPTRQVFKTLKAYAVQRVVLISSICVYGFSSLPDNAQLDELTPRETFLHYRDSYCKAKIAQEEIAILAAQDSNFIISVLRPGLIYGPERLWSSRLGFSKGFGGVAIGGNAPLPLISVDDCASAVVLAAERESFFSDVYIKKNGLEPPGSLEYINLVGDEQLVQNKYLKIIEQHCRDAQKGFITIPWEFMKQVSKIVSLTGVFCPKLIAKLPLLLLEPSLHARFKPLKYSNCRLKDRLGWNSKSSLIPNLIEVEKMNGT